MKRNCLAAILSLIVVPAFSQNRPVDPTVGANSSLSPKPTPFNTIPNLNPVLFNYTRTFVPQIPVTDTALVTQPAFPPHVATTYLNGWGQPLQSITHAVSPFKDLVAISDMREAAEQVEYLPYAVPIGARFQQSPYLDQQSFYQSKFPDEGNNAYSRSNITSSATSGTTVTSFIAGEAFTGNSRGSSTASIFNSSTNPIRSFYRNFQGEWTSPGVYADRELSGTKKIGQHNSQSIEWTNKDGQLVCKQVLVNGQYLSTYYVYNRFGLIEYILPPKAVNALASNSWAFDTSITNELCFYYQYNAFGQLTKKGTAGRGYDLYVYDRKRRLSYSQTALQRSRSQWSFIVYDPSGRVRFTGTRSGVASVDELNNIFLSGTPVTTDDQKTDYWTRFGYQDGAYPTVLSDGEIRQYNYYDDYIFEAGSPLVGRSFNPGFSTDYSTTPTAGLVSPSLYTNGLLTGTKTAVVNPSSGMNAWLYAAVFYDTKGRILQTQSTNPWTGNNWDVSTTQYEFSGKACRNILQHFGPASSPKPATKLVTNYVYKPSTGQLTDVSVSTDSYGGQVLASYQYNDLGQVTQKVIGGGAEIQNMEYNIRGQLTSVNKAHTEGGNYAEQHFGYKLAYDRGFSEPRYDGSISGFAWRGSNKRQAYGYGYDDAGRMTKADYAQYEPSLGDWFNNLVDYTVSGIRYDENGNMLSMKQRGFGSSDPFATAVDMDRLHYQYYENSNKLQAVTDTVTADYHLHDFLDGGSSLEEYGYDQDGNMIQDVNKGIYNISYNELDLPVSVYTGTKGSILNIYDAAGTLLEKRITYPSASAPLINPCIYKYVGPFVYRNDSLLYFTHPEGRARYLYDSSKFKFDFFIKDHLGNVRMTIVSDVSAQSTDYLATHEVIFRNTENLVFSNIDKVRNDREWADGPNNVKCARLNGGIDSLRIGTSLLLNVMAGDNFELAAHAYYDANEHGSPDPQYADNAGMLESLITTLTGRGFGGMPGPGDGPGGGPGGGGVDYGAVETMLRWENFNQFGEIKGSMTDSSLPQAYINYLMFDEQMQLVPEQSGAIQVTAACADNWSVIGTPAPINIKNNGQLLIYIDGVRTKDVFFDDLHVLHKKGRLLEENHYYPHGLKIRAGASNPVPTREGYQGKELQDEAGLELYDFHARQYDPQIGRFWGIDPADQFPSGYTGMGNNPANMIDPDGMQAFGAGTSSGIPSFAPEFENEAFSYRGNPFDDLYYADPALEAQKGSGDVSAQGTGSAPTQSATSDDVASTADAPDNRYYNDQGQLITVEENNNPDRYFTVGLSTAGPAITFHLNEIDPNGLIGTTARIVYAEMRGGSDNSMAVVAESIRNRMRVGTSDVAGDGSLASVSKFYNVTVSAKNESYNTFANPSAVYKTNSSEAAAWDRSMGAAIRAFNLNSSVVPGVIFYNSKVESMFTKSKYYSPIDLKSWPVNSFRGIKAMATKR